MITIFNGRKRGLAGEQEEIYAQIYVKMRNYLRLFNNGKNLNSWAVFTTIFLHTDEYGWSYPSRDLMQDETGLGEEAIRAAVHHLMTITVEGNPIMHYYRQRFGTDQKSKWGKSAYHVFPNSGGLDHSPFKNLVKQDLAQSPSPDHLGMDDSGMTNSGMDDQGTKYNQSKDNHLKQNQNTDSFPASAADSSKKTRKSAINQSFKDAVAVHVQNIDPKLAGKRTGFIANVIADVAKRRLSVDKLTAEQYQVLADNMPAYGTWIRIEFNVGYDIFAPATHEDMYAKWLTAGKPDPRKDLENGQNTPANQHGRTQSASRLPDQGLGAAGSKNRTNQANHPSQQSNYNPGAVAELHRNRKNGEVR